MTFKTSSKTAHGPLLVFRNRPHLPMSWNGVDNDDLLASSILGVRLTKRALAGAQLDTSQPVGILTRYYHEQRLDDVLRNRMNVSVSWTSLDNTSTSHARLSIYSMGDDSWRIRMPTAGHYLCRRRERCCCAYLLSPFEPLRYAGKKVGANELHTKTEQEARV